MKDLIKDYDIPITGLKTGVHTYEYDVNQSLIDYFGYDDHWDSPAVKATVTLEKGNNVMRLAIEIKGDVRTWCDMTDEEFRLPIQGREDLTVKIQEIPTDDDSVIVLSPLDVVLNVGQYIYEVIVLSVPQKRYHPSYEAQMRSEDEEEWDDEEIVQVYSTEDDTNENNEEEDIDPRWAKLKDILN